MNCFQTRKEFPNFWRQRLEPAKADTLASHLERCGLCEQAYRFFALTAPVLYSDSEAVDAMLGIDDRPRPVRARRSRAAGDATESRATVWTALSMLIAASVIAYVAATAPAESLSDALSNGQPTSAVSAVQDPPPSSFLDDFAG